MANQSTFPTTLDGTPTDRTSGDSVPSEDWNQYLDAIDQLETKVGVDGSAVTGSIDYKLAYKDIGEGHITILPWNYSSITQGTWVFYFTSAEIFYGGFYNSSSTQNDQLNFKVYLAAGTYTFVYCGPKSADYGILTLLFDDASQGTIDLYANPATYNNILYISNIVVSTSGLKTVSIKAATKNASSSGYTMAPSSLGLFRTA